ncbi:MAG: laccase domain-containing protein, partial [Gallionella sp.]
VASHPQAAAAFTPSLALTGTLSPQPSPPAGSAPLASLSPQAGEGGALAPSEGRGEGAKYLADLYQLARLRLNALGITQIYGGKHCTYRESEKFYSYRRDGVTGRMGTFIWLE